jgi:hypothetical protein
MKTLVITRRAAWTRLLEMCLRSLPRGLTQAISGPSTRFVVGDAPPSVLKRLRPVEVVIPRDLTLRRRLRIPRQGLPDLAHAIDLLVKRETPFAADELLVHAQQDNRVEADQFLSFVLRMTPIIRLREALDMARIPVRAVASVAFEGPEMTALGANVVAALRPSLRIRALAQWLPILVTAIAAFLLSQGILTERQSQLAAMQQRLTQRTTELESLSRRLEGDKQRNEGRDAVAELLRGVTLPYEGLRWLRANLPDKLEVSHLEFADGEMRLSVRSPDILTDIESLNQGGGGSWSASVQGALTTDPSTALEMATIVCIRIGSGA